MSDLYRSTLLIFFISGVKTVNEVTSSDSRTPFKRQYQNGT